MGVGLGCGPGVGVGVGVGVGEGVGAGVGVGEGDEPLDDPGDTLEALTLWDPPPQPDVIINKTPTNNQAATPLIQELRTDFMLSRLGKHLFSLHKVLP